VAIDVNSGRATREHHIEDTALKTNCEAAEEVARQLRLRDLAGLIVIDFIDMDEGRNNRTVERRLKEALRHDRARIQVGRISHFGLLEMSRQRIRTSVLESSTEKCPVCGGSGHVRSVSSVALQLLRGIEEMLIKGAMHNLSVRTRAEVALYVLNHKRAHLRALEERFRITITVSADATVNGQQSFVIDRGEQVHTPEAAKAIAALQPEPTSSVEEEDEQDDIVDEEHAEDEAETEAETAGEEASAPMLQTEPTAEQPHENGHRGDERGERDGGPRRRRRRGRGRGRGGEPREAAAFNRNTAPERTDAAVEHNDGAAGEEDFAAGAHEPSAPVQTSENGESHDGGRRRRRRGRRGGRRNRQGRNGDAPYAGQENGGGRENGNDFAAHESSPQHASDDARAQPYNSPVTDDTPAYTPPRAEPSAAPAPQPAQAYQSEPPRRRSTVREAAPVGASAPSAPSAVVPPPMPVISSTAPEPAATPKRGWWGKRLLGDK
jgi:ribonuclease E